MNIYEELYRASLLPTKCSEEGKKTRLVNWKDKRNQAFDMKRKTLMYEENDFETKSKEIKKSNKNVLIKWKNDRKKKVQPKKKPPFVVGVVRHKLYSPPYSQKSLKSNEQKKKLLRQSFAPKNYKFKPPEGLKAKSLHPVSVKSSPFTFNSLFIPQHSTITQEQHAFENVTARTRTKPIIDSSPIRIPAKNVTKRDENQKLKYVKKELYSAKTDEPPIFGKHNLLKFRDKNATTNDVLNEDSSSVQHSSNQYTNTYTQKEVPNAFSPVQQLSSHNPEDISSYRNCEKNQESSNGKENSIKNLSSRKQTTLYSCSQQIQNLLLQNDFRFTEFYSNSQNNQIVKRTSSLSPPDISRVSFTLTTLLEAENKIMSSVQENVETNEKEKNSIKFNESTNNVLNSTVFVDKEDDNEKALNYSDSCSTSNITISDQSNNKINKTKKIVIKEKHFNEEKTSLENVESPSISATLNNENSKASNQESILINVRNFINTDEINPKAIIIPDEQEAHKYVEDMLENSSVIKEDNNVSAKSLKNNCTFELEELPSSDPNTSLNLEKCLKITNNSLLHSLDKLDAEDMLESTSAIKEDNNISAKSLKNNCTFELEELPSSDPNTSLNLEKCVKITNNSLLHSLDKLDAEDMLESTSAIKEDNNVSAKSLKNDSNSICRIEELPSSDHNNSLNLQKCMIISNNNCHNSSKKLNMRKNNLGEPLHDLQNYLSQSFRNNLGINEEKENENIEIKPEIIDLTESPLKRDQIDCKKNSTARNLYNKITSVLSPREFSVREYLNNKIEPVESEIYTGKVSDIIRLVDSLKFENELTKSLVVEDMLLEHRSMETKNLATSDLESNENKLQNSQTSEIETVDLISDDEEDAESYLSRIKARFAITAFTPRKAFSSIENVLDSSGKTRYSQTFIKKNSPKLQNISGFQDTSGKENTPVPNTSLAVTDIPNASTSHPTTPQQPLAVETNSPISSGTVNRILALRNRKVTVSPSPTKKKNTPRKILNINKNLPDANEETSIFNIVISPPRILKYSTCTTPRLQKQAKENIIPNLQLSSCDSPQLLQKKKSLEADISSPMRILSLRSRKVHVTPSPKKITPKRTPRGKKTPLKLCEQ